ncbi:hypothetical protein V1477_008990 [Vespula maculifrons]|uniref:Ribosomal protein S10 n=1 Tax=Vespula maculifrons TaxID=7453 RepID=A0ABD2CEK3_VESMC
MKEGTKKKEVSKLPIPILFFRFTKLFSHVNLPVPRAFNVGDETATPKRIVLSITEKKRDLYTKNIIRFIYRGLPNISDASALLKAKFASITLDREGGETRRGKFQIRLVTRYYFQGSFFIVNFSHKRISLQERDTRGEQEMALEKRQEAPSARNAIG